MANVVQIPIFRDNYTHLLVDETIGVAVAIDPADPEPVVERVRSDGLDLRAVLCTHHHWDHAGGNEALARAFRGIDVVASAGDAPRMRGVTRVVREGDSLAWGGLRARVLGVGCHTRGHVAYLFGDDLFCGDTLFVGGCGRFFEGEAADMVRALCDVFGALPGRTRVWCGHEYTVANLAFALTVEPDNDALRAKMRWALARRAEGRSTVPSTLAEERSYNPFVRVREPAVQAVVWARNDVEAMARLRARKDRFTSTP